MPIHIDLNHASHLAVAVIRGSLSADDVRNAMHQFMAADARSYRKIIDVASPDTPLEGTDIEQIAQMIKSRPSTGPRGPLAFVVGPGVRPQRTRKCMPSSPQGASDKGVRQPGRSTQVARREHATGKPWLTFLLSRCKRP